MRGCSRAMRWTWLALVAAPLHAAEIVVDGRLDEPFWAGAQVFRDFVVTQPDTRAAPLHPTEARIAGTPEGIAVAIIASHPPATPRDRTLTARDADSNGDRVNFVIDFDADGKVAYDLTVALSGSVQDATFTNETIYSTDWDSDWQSAVLEEEQRWTVEMLLPWSMASMRGTDTATRTIGIYFDRVVGKTQERSAFPSASFMHARFVSDFHRIEIPQYTQSILHVFPYATVMSDQVSEQLETRFGADLFWKPSGDFQLTAALNPDFGQVEADDLVVNFDAIETFFSDKRPFFTENQGLFDLRTPDSGLLIYTRRIGGPRDDRENEAAEIDAALKLNGSAGALDYGVLGAVERDYADDLNSAFYAQRLLYPIGDWQVGYLGTYVDRPFLERSARVDAIDVTLRAGPEWFLSGQVLTSRIDQPGADKEGDGAWVRAFYTPSQAWQHELELTHFQRTLDFNDMGFQRRPGFNEMEYTITRRYADFGAGDPRGGVTWVFEPQFRRNDSGDELPTVWSLTREVRYKSGWNTFGEFIVAESGVDDLISRGNGNVKLEPRLVSLFHNWQSPRLGPFRFNVGTFFFQEGNDDYAFQAETNLEYFPRENLGFNVFAYPRWSRDWLIWREADRFASYERLQVRSGLNVNWFPAEGHELRVKLQWLAIDAHDATPLRIGAGGNLVRSDDTAPDFTVDNFGLQARYRWTFAPQSDLYVVYSRGGFAAIDDNPRDATAELFSDALDLRDADQFLVKLRYRF